MMMMDGRVIIESFYVCVILMDVNEASQLVNKLKLTKQNDIIFLLNDQLID